MTSQLTRTQTRYLRFLRIATIVMAIISVNFRQIFAQVPNTNDPPIFSLMHIAVSLVFFSASFFVPVIKKHAYEALIVFASCIAILLSVLVTYNNSRVEYIFDLLVVYLPASLFVKNKGHLAYFSSTILGAYTSSVAIFTLLGVTQNLYSVIFFLTIFSVGYYWNRTRLTTQEIIEKKVNQRTHSLQEERAKLNAAINAFQGAFIIASTDGSFVTTNDKLTNMLTTHKVHSVQELQNIFGGKYNILKNFKFSLESKKAVESSEISYNQKYFKISITPIFTNDNNQSPSGVLIVINDQTEEIALQRTRDEFFSIASHELRTPLTAIKGNASIILDYYPDIAKDKKLSSIIKTISNSSEQLIHIVNDFLDLSRLEQGRVKYKYTTVNLIDVIKEVISSSSSQIPIKIKTPTTNAPVTLDKDRLKQVLVNVLNNAIKFTPKGEVVISVAEENKYWKIIVKDTGIGIPPERQNLLFRKFQQANESLYTRDTTKGTGLGLYISRLIMRGMGGNVQLVSSSVNKGSKFAIVIPKTKEEVARDIKVGLN